ncbi:unnamed protein product [Acanthoscelides obtectus]|uniref:Uncharacterized protein n=1 Tax=Acanthoscelides obtectus TaxID=200917 RepID=A0A9P0K5Y3_ACAOB|nr:unnamed protein product [Acanthoscelides obtectus]CAK1669751.1 hypothetical protein AOBTE_LOCUS27227 [Acanthoscelides obtectus]
MAYCKKTVGDRKNRMPFPAFWSEITDVKVVAKLTNTRNISTATSKMNAKRSLLNTTVVNIVTKPTSIRNILTAIPNMNAERSRCFFVNIVAKLFTRNTV